MRHSVIAALLLGMLACKPGTQQRYTSWPAYGGSPEMIRYSSLTLIDTSNVSQLEVAWMFSSGDADTAAHSQIQCNPIVIDSVLYAVSPQMKLLALHAGTGKLLWQFDPLAPNPYDSNRVTYHILLSSRGVAFWTDGKQDRRIFFTAGSRTYAVDATNGKPIRSFGDLGSIDLHKGLDRDVDELFVVNNSPGVVYQDLLILGSRVEESTPAAPGHIRAYDVRTGERRWIFHTIPHPGEYGYDTWEDTTNYKYIGGANVWSGFALDEQRGLLFAPTGSAAYDFYGGKRKGQNLFANCLLALDAKTGKRVWHYQVMHHDLWDKDLPTPPALVTLTRNGKKIDAVAQPTKNGLLYVLDRETGTPLFDIPEVPVDTLSDLEGEKPWPTQPVPRKPVPYSRQTLTENDINPYVSRRSQELIRQQLRSYRHGNMFVLPGSTPSLIFPGFDGGAEWGGPAFDPKSGWLYVNANEMAWVMDMKQQTRIPPPKENLLQAGQRLYGQHCQTCHGPDRKGTGNHPSLASVKSRLTPEALMQQINNGRRMMPGFSHLARQDKEAIVAFLLEQQELRRQTYTAAENPGDSIHFMPYRMMGYNKFLSPEGLPAISPPWGTLNAIDLNTGELVWKIPLGGYDSLLARGLPPTGTENYGGPVVTAGGLVFIAASRDGKIRAFHKQNGKLLWEHSLPAPGFATPSVYRYNGKQYLVIACGGGKLETPSSDIYLAFTLK